MGIPAIIAGVQVAAGIATSIGTATALAQQAVAAFTGARGRSVSGFPIAQDPLGVLQAGPGRLFTPGADIDIQSQGFAPGTKFEVDPATGEVKIIKRRRRRKRLLTCSDKADIAFVTGTLGKGSLASTAISSLLSRCG